jgi:hypothetical protein
MAPSSFSVSEKDDLSLAHTHHRDFPTRFLEREIPSAGYYRSPHAHEGSHVADDEDFNRGGSNSDLTMYQTEQKAWLVAASVAQALNMKKHPPKGPSAYKSRWSEADTRAAINQILADPERYGITPANQGNALSVIKSENIQSIRSLYPRWYWQAIWRTSLQAVT